jgi:hypothetical protein
MENRESLGLYIRNNGPEGGPYEDFSSSKLYMESSLPIRHFTNWDAGLSSLEKTDLNNMQGLGVRSYPGITNSITDMKTVDDLAFIAHGEYTDINKSIKTIQTIGRSYYYYYNSVQYDLITTQYATDGLIYIDKMDLAGLLYNYDESQTDFDTETFPSIFFNGPTGLFLRIKYNDVEFDYTLTSASELTSMRGAFAGLYGKHQVIGPNSLFWDEDYINKVSLNPFIYQKFKYLAFRPNLPFFSTDATYLNYGQFPSFGTSNQAEITYDLDISLIKYTPAYNCGKVDIYQRKTGRISSISNDGRIICVGHPLEDGDVIKISEINHPSLHGLKYVQATTTDTFVLYDDEDFTQRTDVSGIISTGSWTCVSNVYGGDFGRWKYRQTIFSPNGKNRYDSYTEISPGVTESATTGFIKTRITPSDFESITNYDTMFEMDYGVVLSEVSASPLTTSAASLIDLNRGLMETSFQSALEDWRLNRGSFITNFRFGCSIDIKKKDNLYYLLVGERGPQTCLHLDNINLPTKPLCGAAYLFEINENLNVEHLETYYAHTGDSDIAQCPVAASPYYGPEKLFIYQPSAFGDVIDGVRGNYSRLIEYKSGYDYWYGAMALHMYDPQNRNDDKIPGYFNYNVLDAAIADTSLSYNADSIRAKYFTGSPITYGINRFITADIDGFEFYKDVGGLFRYNHLFPSVYGSNKKISYYPYIDSFGKSVALDIIGDDFFVFCSSKVKPYVIRPELGLSNVSRLLDPAPDYTGSDSQIASTSCGYIHVFKNGAKIQKIKEDGQFVTGKLFAVQSYRADRFAKTMYAKNGKLAFGFSKPFNNYAFGSEPSKILFYSYNGSSYTLSSAISNRNQRDILIYNPKGVILPDHKDYWLTGINISSPATSSFISLYQPSDKFGDFFIWEGDLVITNGYDSMNEYNESNVDQTSITIDSTLTEYWMSLNYIDQVFIYESGQYKGRIVPQIDTSEAEYSYASLSPLYERTIKAFYSNTDIMALDLNMEGGYAIHGDRLIIRDPLSLSIYDRTPSSRLNEFYARVFKKKTLPLPGTNNKKFSKLNNAISILRPASSSLNDDRGGPISGTYSEALDILSVDGSSYSYDMQNMEYLPLMIKSDGDTPSIDLFLKVIENGLSSVDLILSGGAPSSLNLFMDGDDFKPFDNESTLLITGALPSSSGYDLFINNEPAGYLPLFIQWEVPLSDSSATTSYIYGSVVESYPVASEADLFITGTAHSSDTSSLPLFIETAKGEYSDGAPLYIDNTIYDSEDGHHLVIDGSITGNKYVEGSSNLFITNSETNEGTAPLFIKQFGVNGEPVENVAALFIRNEQVLEGMELFISSESVNNLGINLYIDGVSICDTYSNCFIRGYLE